MKDLVEFIREALVFEAEDEEKESERGKLKFIIYDENGKTKDWLRKDEPYQKIECYYEEKPDYNEGIKIDFLLGKKNGVWHLWAGKNGVVTYTDEPYKYLKTDEFDKAILAALDEAEKLIDKVKEQPSNWVQFYV